MASNSAERVLNTIELLREILLTLDDPKALFICAQVCRAWFVESARILWHGGSVFYQPWKSRNLQFGLPRMSPTKWRTPPLRFLCQIAKSPVRFRWYIGLVNNLTLSIHSHYGHSQDDALSEQEFCNLFRKDLWSTFTGSGVHAISHPRAHFIADLDYLEPLIQPKLRLFFQEGYWRGERFGQMLANKSDLRILYLESENLEHHTSLQQYFAVSNLQYLDLNTNKVYFEDDQLWSIAITKISSLQHLSTGGWMTEPTTFQLTGSTSNLRSLQLANCSRICRGLLRHLPFLESFRYRDDWDDRPEDELEDEDEDEDHKLDVENHIFEPITACTKLRELEIDCEGAIIMPTDAMATLAFQTPLIERFEISASEHYDTNDQIHGRATDSDRLCQAVQLWPQLSVLYYGLKTQALEAKDLNLISRGCPKLRHMYVSSNISLKSLTERSIVFPKLQCLGIDALIIDLQTSITSRLDPDVENPTPDAGQNFDSDSESDLRPDIMLLEDDLLTAETKGRLLLCMPHLREIRAPLWVRDIDDVEARLKGCAIVDGQIAASGHLKNRIDPGHWLMHSVYEEATRNWHR